MRKKEVQIDALLFFVVFLIRFNRFLFSVIVICLDSVYFLLLPW